MTQLLERPPIQTPVLEPPELSRRLFTLAEFEQMSNAGLFADEHAELLNGEIFVKGMQSPQHSYAVTSLTEKWLPLFQGLASLAAQVPMILRSPPPNFVEPDIMLRRLPSSSYSTRSTTNEDVLLILEVSDSTLERDQNAKLRAYAKNGVADYWILNLQTQQLEVRREPDGEDYLLVQKYKAGQAVAPLEFADLRLEWWL